MMTCLSAKKLLFCFVFPPFLQLCPVGGSNAMQFEKKKKKKPVKEGASHNQTMNICNRIVRDKYVNKIFHFNCVKHTFEMNSKENVSERLSIKMAYLYFYFCQFGFVLFLFFVF